MEQHAIKRCFLSLRIPPADGILGELSLAIYGSRYDSPNAIIAYNALYSMGIYANSLIEEGISHWTNSTLEEAFTRAKRHLHLQNTTEFDNLITDTLNRRLKKTANSYVWPEGMRSALFWWTPANSKIKDFA